MDIKEAFETVARRMADVFGAVFALAAPAAPAALDLGAEDIEGQLATHESGLLLGIYDEAHATERLEDVGFLEVVRERAGAPCRVRIHAREGVLRIYRADRAEGPDALLIEIKGRLERTLPERLKKIGFPPGDYLGIDWLLLQDPARPFAPGRRPLPGQTYPGLGLGWQVIDIIRRAAERLGCCGIFAIPAYYHSALIFHRVFAFADPVAEGRFEALLRDLGPLPITDAAWAVHEGRVRCQGWDAPVRWEGLEMVMPLSDAVRAYFVSAAYTETAARVLSETRFFVDGEFDVNPADPVDPAPPARA